MLVEFFSSTRPRLEEALGVDAFDSYGLSEMYGPGVAFECQEQNGLHVWESAKDSGQRLLVCHQLLLPPKKAFTAATMASRSS